MRAQTRLQISHPPPRNVGICCIAQTGEHRLHLSLPHRQRLIQAPTRLPDVRDFAFGVGGG